MCRSRAWWALLILVIIASGLFVRSSWVPQGFFSKYAGDALWALVVFLGWGFLASRATTFRIAALAILFSILIECSQLYHAPWIDWLRTTIPGRLILGTTFAWADLAAYLVGILAGILGEKQARRPG